MCKLLIIIFALLVDAGAQQPAGIAGQGTIAGQGSIGFPPAVPPIPPPTGNIELPQTWINGFEYVGTTSNTITFPVSGTGGTWTCGATSYGPYTANSLTSLNQAVADAEACRNTGAGHPGTQINIPAGELFSGSTGLLLAQSPGDDPVANSNFIVITSTSPLPLGRTACSHGIQDNVPESTQIGIRNLHCDGQSLQYQLSTTLYNIPTGPFTLANGIAVNSSDYNDISHMYTVQCTVTSVCRALSTLSDSNNVAAHHYAVLNGEFRMQAGIGVGSGSTIALSVNPAPTMESQIASHIHFAYDYVHGDWGDAAMSGGAVIDAPTGTTTMANAISFDCIYCSVSYIYSDQNLRPSAEGHGISALYGKHFKIVHNWLEGSSINWFCGGAGSTMAIPGFRTCEDVEYRGNRNTYPYSWIMAYNFTSPPFRVSSVFPTTGGTGTGARINLISSATGNRMTSAAVQSGASGYTVGDTLLLGPNLGSRSAANGRVTVTSVNGGVVTGIVVASGAGYSVGTGLATSNITGTGSGLTVNITAVSPSGAITSVVMANAGTGYANNSALNVVQAGGAGGTVTVSGVTAGAANGIVLNSGTGYLALNYTKKNGYEYKTGWRILTDGNIIENSDYTGVQGMTSSLKTTNSSSRPGDNYTNEVSDVTYSNNIIRNGCSGADFGGRSIGGTGATGYGSARPAWRLDDRNVLIYNMSTRNCTGYGSFFGFRWSNAAPGTTWNNSSAVEDSTGTRATYTLSNVDTGTGALAMDGMWQSTIAIGDPVAVMNCTGGTNPAAFNMSPTAPLLTMGPGAIDGTLIDGLTVVIPWTAPANATATGCSLFYGQGWPNIIGTEHNTGLSAPGTEWPTGISMASASNGTTNPATLARNIRLVNSIFSGGGLAASAIGEGTRAQIRGLDPATEIVHHNVFAERDRFVSCPGHTAVVPGGIDICYSSFDDNHIQASWTTCNPATNPTPVCPSTLIWGTPTIQCAGSDPTAEDCVGIIGYMSTPSYTGIPGLLNWHQYRLCHAGDVVCTGKASIYAAGSQRQASDGTDMGVNIPALDAAQVLTQYCASCGSFPDYPGAPGTVMPAARKRARKR